MRNGILTWAVAPAISVVMALHAPCALAAFALSEVGAARGIGPYLVPEGKGGGVAAADYDNDGDVDLFAPTGSGLRHGLYRNGGDGTFTDVSSAVGLTDLDSARTALWIDYDGDDRLDLFVLGDCFSQGSGCFAVSTLRLFHQRADGSFEDTTAAAAIPDDAITMANQHRGGVAAGDLDGNGYLDLVFGLWRGVQRVLLNQGDGTFREVSESSGIGGDVSYFWQPLVFDFDGDGRMDVYSAIDFYRNRLWLNLGNGEFEDIAESSETDNAWNDMGAALGDYDNDGDADLYVTNIEAAVRGNMLFRNDSTSESVAFTRYGEEAGVRRGGWGWGATFFDADNDGDLDLAATNGWSAGSNAEDRSVLFLNDGAESPAFTEIGAIAGFDDNYWGSSVVAIDFDRDGDLDLVQTCNGNGTGPHVLRLLENTIEGPEAANRYLNIRPRMEGPNRRAIGAVVRAETGDRQMMRPVLAGTSFYGQEPAEAFFGLGDATMAERVTVEWPTGFQTVVRNVAADQTTTVTEWSGTQMAAGRRAVLFVPSPPARAATGPQPTGAAAALPRTKKTLRVRSGPVAPPPLGEQGASFDPEVHGGRITIMAGAEPNGFTIAADLAAERWRRRTGSDGTDVVVKFRNRSGPVRLVSLSPSGGIRVRARGAELPFDLLEDPGSIAVRVDLGAQSYCFALGDTERFRRALRLRSGPAAPPRECIEPAAPR